MPMSQPTSEFIFFRLKPSVRPEDPTNEEGERLLSIFRNTQHESGHQSSAWGRSAEDNNTVVWAINWTDARASASIEHLTPYLDPDAPPPKAIYATLSPPLCSADALIDNPVTELCTLSFADSLSVPEKRQLNGNLIDFRTALVKQLPEGSRPISWSMGHVDRPGSVQHAKSPSGQAVLYLLVVGWESIDVHNKSRETEQFVSSISPIREKSLGAIPGLELKHVSFQKT
ncbi:uncharacterized protein N7484_004298 [Penicillium longicatenatum]|uniref:uncharacterized protein n=1 Tax=Penicillium longicatenatum TaxID=1561947 RepID=UPI00254885E2|nr:uncharacterized protein N7484_004298 [Penicillium longicatenatum]KAJ5650575.1 hypothetical protein N7484_004298 [Penicillium longicatenatum]